MLSTSTFSSTSSNGFISSPGTTTPSSQYSNDSRKTGANPLTELIETEQAYLETLKLIDSQIAPIWMKQMTSAAPDFSELLKYIHDILKVNKRFCMKLTRIASNPQTISELGDALMQWVNDLEIPYANYSRSYIPNLNARYDILRNPAIHNLLQNLSANAPYEVNLEYLFSAPIQQLKYYKGLYSRLLEGTDSGRADHKLLLNANKRIDTIMLMSSRNNNVGQPAAASSRPIAEPLPFIQTHFQASNNNASDLTLFERQVDCSRTADLYSGAQINYQLRVSNPGTQLVMRNSFVMLPTEEGPSIRVHAVLTTEALIVCRELTSSQFLLMYPPISIADVTVKAESLDRELVGEYMIKFSVLGKKHLVMRADSKDIRNTWIGADPQSPSSTLLSSRTLSTVVQKKKPSSSSTTIRNTDIFTYYHESGGVSPLESSDEDEGDKEQKKSRDTIMDIYDNHLYDYTGEGEFPPVPSTNTLQQSVKALPHIPSVPQNVATNGPTPPNKDRPNVNHGHLPPISTSGAQLVKDSSHVQMTYIQPPTAQMSTMSISPPIPQPLNTTKLNSQPASSSSSSSSSPSLNTGMNYSNNSNNKISPLPASPDRSIGAGIKNLDGGKPSSPRAVEVQRAVIPEVMQAVTQKTDDYISSNKTQSERPVVNNQMNRPPMQSRSGSAPQQNKNLPRVSSIKGSQAQQRPAMGYSNTSPVPMHSSKPYPNQHQQQQRQQPYGSYGSPPSSHSPQQQQFSRPNPPPHGQQSMNKPIPSPSMSSSQRGPPSAQSMSPHMQQSPARQNSPLPAGSRSPMESLSSPPHSPNSYNPGNDVKQVLYSTSQCDVFHWQNQSWYAAQGQCILQVRLTHSNRTCVAVQLQNTGQLYLNAWILPNTVIRQPSPTDVNISLYMGTKKENYLIHFSHPQDATVFANILNKAHQESATVIASAAAPEMEEPEVVDTINVPQTLKPVMQCKAKLFIKNETSNWSTFGSVSMRISQQSPSMRMLIQIENDKNKLVSAVVKSGNVEKISSKRISFLLQDEAAKTSIVYMIHLREDQTGNKIYEYLRTKNAENGW